MTGLAHEAAGPAPTLPDGARLGAALVERAEIDEQDWRLAREVARRNATSECRALLDLGYLSEERLADAIARATGLDRWSEEDEDAPPSEEIPAEFMESNAVLLFEDESGLRLVVADPSDRFAVGSLLGRLGGRLSRVQIGTHKAVRAYLERAAPEPDDAGGAGADAGPIDVSGELSALRELASEAPVIRFFNQAVERAMDLRASDIHLERFDRRVSLRYRVDGVLVEQPPPPAPMYDPILCRIKIMSNLDIAERRLAQDGRIRHRLRGRAVDMRVSIVPTMYGQDAAIRIQDRQRLAEIRPEDLGFDPGHIDRLRAVASRSHGILLITGPTGSGKTTTLYSLLRGLATTRRKVVTVEDPVEYAMDGVNQIQVNAAIGLTFGVTLRNILRHDPDVILVGEIRDRETGEMAFQSALTGHMVLSTLHTNDVPSSFVRLVDMGVEPYLVNAAVEGVSAQRLLRRVCAECRNEAGRRDGCRACNGLGYRGRVAVMEFSAVTPEVKRIMLQGADEHRLREALLVGGYLPMRADAQRLIDEGVTDEAEAARVLGAAPPDGEDA